jgi:two-component system chemotaxis sensor kinase CheA
MGADRLSNEMITNPTYRSLAGRDAFVVDVRVPIMRSNTFDIVGIVGITISMEELQILTDSIKPYGTGRVILCSSDGTIAVHYDLALRGQYIVASNFQRVVPFTSPEDSGPGINLIFDSLFTQKYTVLKTGEVMVVAYPCTLGAVGSPWVVITSVPLSVIMSPLNNLIRFSVIFIFAAGALAALVMYITSRSLTQRAEEMQRGLERATAMQDNLKYGLCLLDHDLVIQEAYSKALERVLTISELQGKNFIELLSSSLKTNEIEGLKDYFNMIFNRAFDQKMLEDINPINEFSYISTETGDAKTLRSSFSLTEWGQNATFIMATLEDITAERELAKQLAEAGNIREQEMNSLFQVIQLNPRVLTDFIEDTEHEFEQINKTLQDRSIPPRNVLREIYQSIHAIKSDALILSLEHFANGLHKLESTIKALQEKEDIPFDDILGIIFELEAVLKEKDKLKEAITKIENFRSHAGQGANQETYILTETLHKVCEKAQAKLDKKVRLVQEQIDDSVLTHGPRRIIKEILVQLIRNAVYHGIETVIGRQKAGKDPMGEIRLAIWYMDDKAHLKLEDDGGGIDYEKVLRSARKQNLIKNPLDAASKDYLLQLLFSPGFSTAEKTDMTAGRGIGLSLVRDRVKELKGSIKIRTEPGKGTTFVISFPLNLPDGQEELTPLI